MAPPPPPANSPSQKATLQFLSSVFSQRGPASLPYTEGTRWLIRRHLLSLTSSFPSLDPKTAAFTHNDGRTINLLQADGTIPMPFQGVTYNIPVIIWLMESYPRHPPCVYVNPTREMIAKRNHPNVNPSGLVSVPYLQNWIFPSSNLVDLVRELGAVFGRDPPLYSQRLPNPNPSPNSSLNHAGNQSSLSNLSNSVGYGGYQQRPSNPVRSQTDAIKKIVECVQGDILQLRKLREMEMENLFSAQAVLRKREEEIIRGIKGMTEEKEALEVQLQVVLMNTDVLQAWVGENKGKMELISIVNGVEFDVDDVFEFGDSLSRQMLDCTAADLAIEDSVYGLDKAVQEGVLGFDQYLRSVRLLSREQFFHWATAAKVRAVQMQARVAGMAARVPHYGS